MPKARPTAAVVLAAALLALACKESTSSEPLDPIGEYSLTSINGSALPQTLSNIRCIAFPGPQMGTGTIQIAEGRLRMSADGTLSIFVEGSGTCTNDGGGGTFGWREAFAFGEWLLIGSTVHFTTEDLNGDPYEFSGTVSKNRITYSEQFVPLQGQPARSFAYVFTK